MTQQTNDTFSPQLEPNATGECCTGAQTLTEAELVDDVRTFASLGNDTRYEALRLIAGADEEVCVCELEPSLGVSQRAVSQALSRLFDAGLVERRKEGRWRYYSATLRVERILSVLDETRAMADD